MTEAAETPKPRPGAWSDEETKELARLYNLKDRLSAIEIAYRLNKKCETDRNTGAIGQRLTALRAAGTIALRDDSVRGQGGKVTPEAQAFMKKMDAKVLKAKAARRAAKHGTLATAPIAPVNTKTAGKRDPLTWSDSATRVMEVNLGDKGSIRVEVSGPILLNDQLVTSIAEVIGKAMTI